MVSCPVMIYVRLLFHLRRNDFEEIREKRGLFLASCRLGERFVAERSSPNKREEKEECSYLGIHHQQTVKITVDASHHNNHKSPLAKVVLNHTVIAIKATDSGLDGAITSLPTKSMQGCFLKVGGPLLCPSDSIYHTSFEKTSSFVSTVSQVYSSGNLVFWTNSSFGLLIGFFYLLCPSP
ncbi:hypothetical protein CEXT_129521 [Caerostris extrusa]|uniref:Uncharacterized protein n=1 Tax=Caerostris extrusa TaxID=172846 RepID=A0AAV4X5P4_CAEEX|nr:hypothetical protein CEXT_129521 [Caerostris extrusa]